MNLSMNNARTERVIKQLEEKGVAQMLVTDPSSIFYLTGKMIAPGSRLLALYISGKGNHRLFVNRLFPIREDLGIDICWFSDTDDIMEMMASCTDHTQPLGVDRKMTAEHLLALQALGAGSAYVNTSACVDKVRGRKDGEEQLKMIAASQINDLAMAEFKKLIRPGVTEDQVAKQIEDIYKSLGADGNSFVPHVAFGANASYPHHKSDGTVLKEGDCVLFDVGCKKDQYCSDMTRTFFYKYVSDEDRAVYDLVLRANLAGEGAIRPGARFCDIDRAARSVIEEGGHGPEFLHRLGHSIGIDVHEPGDANTINTDEVMPGNVFSCEPGVYVAGKMGVRIEDLCMVTEDGVKILNHYPKELEIIG